MHAPSLARSFVTVLASWFVTQMCVPSKATPRGPLPAGKVHVPTHAPSLARSFVTVSAPVFEVQKVSTDLTGDPDVLLAGETLRYTITIRNVGTANATDVILRDQVPGCGQPGSFRDPVRHWAR